MWHCRQSLFFALLDRHGVPAGVPVQVSVSVGSRNSDGISAPAQGVQCVTAENGYLVPSLSLSIADGTVEPWLDMGWVSPAGAAWASVRALAALHQVSHRGTGVTVAQV